MGRTTTSVFVDDDLKKEFQGREVMSLSDLLEEAIRKKLGKGLTENELIEKIDKAEDNISSLYEELRIVREHKQNIIDRQTADALEKEEKERKIRAEREKQLINTYSAIPEVQNLSDDNINNKEFMAHLVEDLRAKYPKVRVNRWMVMDYHRLASRAACQGLGCSKPLSSEDSAV